MPPADATTARSARRGTALATLVLCALVLTAVPAAAHVDLADSYPADGSVVDGPVDAIELTFTLPAEPADDGVVVVTGADAPVAVTVTQVADTTLRVVPDEPLPAGTYGVGWTVRAGDAHPRSGVIGFTVAGDVTAGAGEAGEATPSAEPGTSASGTPGDSSDVPTSGSGSVPESLAVFAAGPDTSGADWLGRAARTLGLLGALVGIGALVFGLLVPVGNTRESRAVVFWARRGGLAILVALPFEMIAQAALLRGGSLIGGLGIDALASALAGPFGWAVLLRGAGGAGLLWGTRLPAESPRPRREPAPVAVGGATGRPAPAALNEEQRLDPAESPAAVAGAVALAVAFLFDGHTVTASPAWPVRLADVVHVGAAATWVGGVVMVATVLAVRHRAGESLRASALMLRFSTIAAASLAAVGAAGVVLAWAILDSPGELFGTPWGRMLIAKLAVVGAAASFGAYHHFVLIPRLRRGDSAASDLVRRTVRAEAVILMLVVAATAVLVGAGS